MATRIFSPLITRIRRRIERVEGINLSENYTRLELREDFSEITIHNTNPAENADYSEVSSKDGNVNTVGVETANGHPTSAEHENFVIKDRTNHSKTKTIAFLGIALTIVASLLFSANSLMIKLAESIPSLEVGFMRLALGFVFSLPVVIFFNDKLIHPWKKISFLLLRGTIGATGMNLNIYAVKHMPLADARVIIFTSPVFTVLLGRIFLKEKVTKFDLMAMVLSLGGVVLIGRPSFLFGSIGKSSSSKQVWLPTILALCGACSQAFGIIMTRKISQELPARVVVFYSGLAGTVISLSASLIFGGYKYPDCGTYDTFYIIASASVGYIAQLIVTKALSMEKASVVSLVRTVGIAFSFILQLTVLHVAPNGLSIGGAFLVLLCNVAIFLKKYLDQKKKVNQS